MDENLSDAWGHFLDYLKESGEYDLLNKADRQYIYKATSDLNSGKLGETRAQNIFDKHAPGRYIVRVVVAIRD